MTLIKQQLKLEIHINIRMSTPTALKRDLMLSDDKEDPQYYTRINHKLHLRQDGIFYSQTISRRKYLATE
jgi:hypothetical protein